MSAARDLALWVKEHAREMDSLADAGRQALALADVILLSSEEVAKPTERSLADRAFDMWMVMASSGEYRVGPSGKDIVRTAREMLREVETSTPFPEPPVVGRGRLEPTTKDELDLGEY